MGIGKKKWVKNILEYWPRLYLECLRFKRRGHWSQACVVSRSTELVIEGYPRSANSFAQSAFIQSQPVRPNLATHVHSPAQVIQAVRWKIPTLVLLRDPDGAVCAHLAFTCELQDRAPEKVRPSEINDYLRRWIRFYEAVNPYREGFVVGHFSDVTSDFGRVMRKFNQYFDTSYTLFEHTPENASALMQISSHIGPQKERDNIKDKIAELYQQYVNQALRSRTQHTYKRLE